MEDGRTKDVVVVRWSARGIRLVAGEDRLAIAWDGGSLFVRGWALVVLLYGTLSALLSFDSHISALFFIAVGAGSLWFTSPGESGNITSVRVWDDESGMATVTDEFGRSYDGLFSDSVLSLMSAHARWGEGLGLERID